MFWLFGPKAQLLDMGIKPTPATLEVQVPTSGPPGKSQNKGLNSDSILMPWGESSVPLFQSQK